LASWQFFGKISVKNPMKVALVSFHSFSHPGGVKRHLLALNKEYQKRKIETKIIVPRRKIKEDYGKDTILLGTSFPINFGGGISDLGVHFNPFSLEMTLRKEKFDILHFHNFSFPSGLQFLLSPSTFKTLNILTFHSDVERSNFLNNFPQLLDLFVGFCNWRFDGIIFVSEVALKIFAKYKKPKTIIPNGVDLTEFHPGVKKIKRFLDGKINLLFVGRIEERKGLIYLLKSFEILQRKFSNLRLIIVGDGPEKENCQKFVQENKLQNVLFEGERENDLPSYYASSHIFCAPSIYGETFGLVLLEAMASGLPVVAFANQGYQELLRGKKTEDFLVEPKDYKSFAKKLEILIKSESLRKEMGEWGIKEAQKYSWSRIAERVLEFYRLCQGEKRRFKN
jgi:phosphatidylinositol alpha-mannosyltransferase